MEYLLFDIVFLAVSIYVYNKIKNRMLKTSLVLLSIIMTFYGVIWEALFYYDDWWEPHRVTTVFNIGIEDVIYSITSSFLTLSIFYVFFNVKYQLPRDVLYKYEKIKGKCSKENYLCLLKEISKEAPLNLFIRANVAFIIITIMSYFLFKKANLSSFEVSLIAFLMAIAMFFDKYWKMKKFLPYFLMKGLFVGALVSLLHLLTFALVNLMTKDNWINAWKFQNIDFIVVFKIDWIIKVLGTQKIPLDDFIWFFMFSIISNTFIELITSPKKIEIEIR